MVVTEYGIADLRGKNDAEVIAALLAIADSRFQQALAEQARAAGKLPKDFVLPERYRNNTPERLRAAPGPQRRCRSFPWAAISTRSSRTCCGRVGSSAS